VTETKQWVNQTCERIVASGHVRLYKDLYKDLREWLPCGVACRLIAEGLRQTRVLYLPLGGLPVWHRLGERNRAIAALRRLERYSVGAEYDRGLARLREMEAGA
jgi:hypothetical protein